MEAETGEMWPQAKKLQGLPAATTSQGTDMWGFSFRVSRKNRHCQYPDFRLLTARTAGKFNLVVLSHPVTDTFLWQPQETNTSRENIIFLCGAKCPNDSEQS